MILNFLKNNPGKIVITAAFVWLLIMLLIADNQLDNCHEDKAQYKASVELQNAAVLLQQKAQDEAIIKAQKAEIEALEHHKKATVAGADVMNAKVPTDCMGAIAWAATKNS